MNKEQALEEIKNLWSLNDDTTLGDIKKYYNEITGVDTYSLGNKVDYLYEYAIESMLKDGDIDKQVARELLDEFKV